MYFHIWGKLDFKTVIYWNDNGVTKFIASKTKEAS